MSESARVIGGGQGSEDCHMTLRQQTVAFMRGNQSHFQPFMEDEEEFDHYCNRMEVITSPPFPSCCRCLSSRPFVPQRAKLVCSGGIRQSAVGIFALLTGSQSQGHYE